MIKLVNDTIDKKDIDRLIEWLGTYPRLTKGKLTVEFEEKWSKWIGRKYSVFCNSGSSANLLMLWALFQSDYIDRNAKIVVPAISWATDLAPVVQLGMQPIICDANLKDFSVDLDHLEDIFKKENPAALMLVSVLGLVPDMEKIVSLCNKYNVILLEDTCESMGSEYKGKKLGTFGKISSFSTYFGHHISTIEGGLVSTDDKKLYSILKSIRSHGWDRDLSKHEQKKLRKKWDVDEFNALYTFYYSGFNLRSTDLQAFIGIGQIDKLEDICKKRNKNFQLYNDILGNISPTIPKDDNFISSFAYPVISNKRKKIITALKNKKIEVRPMICGSMGNQPMYVKKYGKLFLKNADIIDKNGFYIPNHPSLSKNDISLISKIIKENNE